MGVATGGDWFVPLLRKRERHGVRSPVFSVGAAVPHLNTVEPAHHVVEPVRIRAVLKGVRDDREPALRVDGRDRFGKLPCFNRLCHKEPQQVPALGRNFNRGNDKEIVIFRHALQHAVVVADRDTVQPALAREANDLV